MSIDILALIPDEVKQKALDTAVDFVYDQAKRHVGESLASKVSLLRSDAAFRREFSLGLRRALERFEREYVIIDPDLAAALANESNLFELDEVQAALIDTIKHPGSVLATEGREELVERFDTVLPTRKNRERVDRAVAFLLRCLAEEVWHLPELNSVYSLQFQRMTAQATREQVELQRAQLRELTQLNSSVRDSLLQLVEAMGQQRLLPGRSGPHISSIPEVFQNLPQPDYDHFVGREAELRLLLDTLRPYPDSQVAIVTIDGVGGVGKSALALAAAHYYFRERDTLPERERFEAIIWASAKQTYLTAAGIKKRSQSLRSLDDIYSAIAVTLERQDILRAEQKEQAHLIRTALTKQRTLLIVDNLETVDDERVSEFIHELPAPTKAIVTGRHRIDVARSIRLKGMYEPEAMSLIEQECAAQEVVLDTREARLLYERTGGIPLAIVWTIAQIGRGYGIDIVLNRLGDAEGDVCRFCFEGVSKHLAGQPAHKLLLALSICTTDASRQGLGEMTALPTLDRDEGLVELERLSLVNKRGDRFSYLPITKTFALDELRKHPDFERQVWRRWINYLKRLGQNAASEINWYANEYAVINDGENILEALEWAFESGSADDVFGLVSGATTYLDAQGNWNKILSILDRAATRAIESDNRKAIARFSGARSWMYRQRGDYEASRRIAKEGLLIYESLGNSSGEAHLLQTLSASVRKQGQYAKSAELSLKALRIAEQLGNGDIVALVKTELGKLARDEGDWEAAWQYFQQVKKWAEERVEQSPRDDSLALGVYGQLAYIAYKTGRYDEAKRLCLISLDFFRQYGTKGYYATLMHRLALSEEALGDPEAAAVHVNEAIYWLDHLGMNPDLVDAMALRDRLATRIRE